MYTGIVEDIGTVMNVERGRDEKYRRISITSKRLVSSIRKGDSIAVDGACLTVVAFSRLRKRFEFEVLQSSFEKTTLGRLAPGSRVNLEAPLRVGDRLGGHFVQGHVETTGRILSIERGNQTSEDTRVGGDDGMSRVFRIQIPKPLMPYMSPEGSVSIDGISLTIAKRDHDSITLVIIPHTYFHTTLQWKQSGDLVNIEPDMLIKHIVFLSGNTISQGIHKEHHG